MKRSTFISCILCTLLLAACSFRAPEGRADNGVDIIPGLEIPSFADNEDIVTHLGYTASYNHSTLVPDWVAWELTAEEANGQLNYQYSFSRDPSVDYPKASREDYSNTGWDKGHMAPRADMKWSAQALEESYYFTNICPQDHEMNSQAWEQIERLSRRIARRYGSVYIVCGPVFTEGRHGTIGKAKVHVPDMFFKALLTYTGKGYQAIGFIVKNQPECNQPADYAVSVDSIEVLLGRDLFPQLPDGQAEASYDWKYWTK
ncbi:MAG: DNA/RNA non-specific endonuclease [Bacteroidales bacterium]|nr:DNA/RNA non-specific endonuclease [Bacteroidales bacterium]